MYQSNRLFKLSLTNISDFLMEVPDLAYNTLSGKMAATVPTNDYKFLI
jgi:hypothetical protein